MNHRKETFGELQISRTAFGGICQVLFWFHSIVVGIPCVISGYEIIMRGTAQGLLPITAIMLFWIGGAIILGIGAMLGTEVKVARIIFDESHVADRRA